MEKKIITNTNPAKEPMPDAAMQREIYKLNQQGSSTGGTWVYSDEHGIVWAPKWQDDMGQGTPPPDPKTPPPLLSELVQWGKSLDLDSIVPNSVMIVKLAERDPVSAQRIHQSIVSMVLAPRAEKLKEKKLTVLFMATDDDISIISEEDMESAGWQKKDKSLIINPYGKK